MSLVPYPSSKVGFESLLRHVNAFLSYDPQFFLNIDGKLSVRLLSNNVESQKSIQKSISQVPLKAVVELKTSDQRTLELNNVRKVFNSLVQKLNTFPSKTIIQLISGLGKLLKKKEIDVNEFSFYRTLIFELMFVQLNSNDKQIFINFREQVISQKELFLPLLSFLLSKSDDDIMNQWQWISLIPSHGILEYPFNLLDSFKLVSIAGGYVDEKGMKPKLSASCRLIVLLIFKLLDDSWKIFDEEEKKILMGRLEETKRSLASDEEHLTKLCLEEEKKGLLENIELYKEKFLMLQTEIAHMERFHRTMPEDCDVKDAGTILSYLGLANSKFTDCQVDPCLKIDLFEPNIETVNHCKIVLPSLSIGNYRPKFFVQQQLAEILKTPYEEHKKAIQHIAGRCLDLGAQLDRKEIDNIIDNFGKILQHNERLEQKENKLAEEFNKKLLSLIHKSGLNFIDKKMETFPLHGSSEDLFATITHWFHSWQMEVETCGKTCASPGRGWPTKKARRATIIPSPCKMVGTQSEPHAFLKTNTSKQPLERDRDPQERSTDNEDETSKAQSSPQVFWETSTSNQPLDGGGKLQKNSADETSKTQSEPQASLGDALKPNRRATSNRRRSESPTRLRRRKKKTPSNQQQVKVIGELQKMDFLLQACQKWLEKEQRELLEQRSQALCKIKTPGELVAFISLDNLPWENLLAVELNKLTELQQKGINQQAFGKLKQEIVVWQNKFQKNDIAVWGKKLQDLWHDEQKCLFQQLELSANESYWSIAIAESKIIRDNSMLLGFWTALESAFEQKQVGGTNQKLQKYFDLFKNQAKKIKQAQSDQQLYMDRALLRLQLRGWAKFMLNIIPKLNITASNSGKTTIQMTRGPYLELALYLFRGKKVAPFLINGCSLVPNNIEDEIKQSEQFDWLTEAPVTLQGINCRNMVSYLLTQMINSISIDKFASDAISFAAIQEEMFNFIRSYSCKDCSDGLSRQLTRPVEKSDGESTFQREFESAKIIAEKIIESAFKNYKQFLFDTYEGHQGLIPYFQQRTSEYLDQCNNDLYKNSLREALNQARVVTVVLQINGSTAEEVEFFDRLVQETYQMNAYDVEQLYCYFNKLKLKLQSQSIFFCQRAYEAIQGLMKQSSCVSNLLKELGMTEELKLGLKLDNYPAIEEPMDALVTFHRNDFMEGYWKALDLTRKLSWLNAVSDFYQALLKLSISQRFDLEKLSELLNKFDVKSDKMEICSNVATESVTKSVFNEQLNVLISSLKHGYEKLVEFEKTMVAQDSIKQASKGDDLPEFHAMPLLDRNSLDNAIEKVCLVGIMTQSFNDIFEFIVCYQNSMKAYGNSILSERNSFEPLFEKVRTDLLPKIFDQETLVALSDRPKILGNRFIKNLKNRLKEPSLTEEPDDFAFIVRLFECLTHVETVWVFFKSKTDAQFSDADGLMSILSNAVTEFNKNNDIELMLKTLLDASDKLQQCGLDTEDVGKKNILGIDLNAWVKNQCTLIQIVEKIAKRLSNDQMLPPLSPVRVVDEESPSTQTPDQRRKPVNSSIFRSPQKTTSFTDLTERWGDAIRHLRSSLPSFFAEDVLSQCDKDVIDELFLPLLSKQELEANDWLLLDEDTSTQSQVVASSDNVVIENSNDFDESKLPALRELLFGGRLADTGSENNAAEVETFVNLYRNFSRKLQLSINDKEKKVQALVEEFFSSVDKTLYGKAVLAFFGDQNVFAVENPAISLQKRDSIGFFSKLVSASLSESAGERLEFCSLDEYLAMNHSGKNQSNLFDLIRNDSLIEVNKVYQLLFFSMAYQALTGEIKSYSNDDIMANAPICQLIDPVIMECNKLGSNNGKVRGTVEKAIGAISKIMLDAIEKKVQQECNQSSPKR